MNVNRAGTANACHGRSRAQRPTWLAWMKGAFLRVTRGQEKARLAKAVCSQVDPTALSAFVKPYTS